MHNQRQNESVQATLAEHRSIVHLQESDGGITHKLNPNIILALIIFILFITLVCLLQGVNISISGPLKTVLFCISKK